MQIDTEQKGEWQAIWLRANVLNTIINQGRRVYNWFFRRALLRYLRPESKMLELGCGRASLSLSLAPYIRSLLGIDISEAAVDQATRAARNLGLVNVKFAVDDCTKLKLAERYDLVWSQGLLEHFADPVLVARQHFSALAPGGVAVLSVPYKYSYHTIWYWLTRPKILRGLWPWTEQRFFDRAELQAVGEAVTQCSKTFFLHPLLLGIVFLEMRK